MPVTEKTFYDSRTSSNPPRNQIRRNNVEDKFDAYVRGFQHPADILRVQELRSFWGRDDQELRRTFDDLLWQMTNGRADGVLQVLLRMNSNFRYIYILLPRTLKGVILMPVTEVQSGRDRGKLTYAQQCYLENCPTQRSLDISTLSRHAYESECEGDDVWAELLTELQCVVWNRDVEAIKRCMFKVRAEGRYLRRKIPLAIKQLF